MAVSRSKRPKFQEIGAPGLRIWGGRIYEEWLPELTGERGRKVLREMAEQDPTIGGILFAIEMLVRQVKWTFTAKDDSKEAKEIAEFAQQALDDLQPHWPDTLSEILSMLTYGWSWMEIVYKYRNGPQDDALLTSKYDDGKIGWKSWAIRGQETHLRWEMDEQGKLTGFTQIPPPDYKIRTIPLNKSLHFRTKSRKDNPEGVSVLRSAYRPWYFKKHVEQIEGIGIERDLAGMPVMWVPPELLAADVTDEQKQLLGELQKIVTNIRRDEQEGVIMPLAYDDAGHEMYKLQLLSTGGSRQFDTDKIIQRYDQRIAMTMMADFVLLGHEQVGSFALADSKTALFATALGAWLDSITATISTFEIPRLLKINGMNVKLAPGLTHSDLENADLGKLGTYLQSLAGAGMTLFPNPIMEKHLLEQAGIPVPEELPSQTEAMVQQAMEAAGLVDPMGNPIPPEDPTAGGGGGGAPAKPSPTGPESNSPATLRQKNRTSSEGAAEAAGKPIRESTFTEGETDGAGPETEVFYNPFHDHRSGRFDFNPMGTSTIVGGSLVKQFGGQAAAIRELHARGHKAGEIAKLLGVRPQAVHGQIAKIRKAQVVAGAAGRGTTAGMAARLGGVRLPTPPKPASVAVGGLKAIRRGQLEAQAAAMGRQPPLTSHGGPVRPRVLRDAQHGTHAVGHTIRRGRNPTLTSHGGAAGAGGAHIEPGHTQRKAQGAPALNLPSVHGRGWGKTSGGAGPTSHHPTRNGGRLIGAAKKSQGVATLVDNVRIAGKVGTTIGKLPRGPKRAEVARRLEVAGRRNVGIGGHRQAQLAVDVRRATSHGGKAPGWDDQGPRAGAHGSAHTARAGLPVKGKVVTAAHVPMIGARAKVGAGTLGTSLAGRMKGQHVQGSGIAQHERGSTGDNWMAARFKTSHGGTAEVIYSAGGGSRQNAGVRHGALHKGPRGQTGQGQPIPQGPRRQPGIATQAAQAHQARIAAARAAGVVGPVSSHGGPQAMVPGQGRVHAAGHAVRIANGQDAAAKARINAADQEGLVRRLNATAVGVRYGPGRDLPQGGKAWDVQGPKGNKIGELRRQALSKGGQYQGVDLHGNPVGALNQPRQARLAVVDAHNARYIAAHPTAARGQILNGTRNTPGTPVAPSLSTNPSLKGNFRTIEKGFTGVNVGPLGGNHGRLGSLKKIHDAGGATVKTPGGVHDAGDRSIRQQAPASAAPTHGLGAALPIERMGAHIQVVDGPGVGRLVGPVTNIQSLGGRGAGAGGHVNGAWKGEVNGQPVIIKPAKALYGMHDGKGRPAPLRDNITPGNDAGREVAAGLVGKYMDKHGAGIDAPRGIVADVGGLGVHSGHAYVGEFRGTIDGGGHQYIRAHQELGVYDVVIGNFDRHGGNWRTDAAGRVWPIDHGLAFPDKRGHSGGGQQNWVQEHGGHALTPESHRILTGLKTDERAIRGELEPLIGKPATNLMFKRIDHMLSTGKVMTTREMNDDTAYHGTKSRAAAAAGHVSVHGAPRQVAVGIGWHVPSMRRPAGRQAGQATKARRNAGNMVQAQKKRNLTTGERAKLWDAEKWLQQNGMPAHAKAAGIPRWKRPLMNRRGRIGWWAGVPGNWHWIDLQSGVH